MRIIPSLIIGVLLLIQPVFAQIQPLKEQINAIIQGKDANIGVAVIGPKGDTLSLNGSRRYPLMSVFKFHLGLKILDAVDQGELALDQKVLVHEEELRAGTWSPLKKKYPSGDQQLTIQELLHYTVSQSDNNGCDILFRISGGTAQTHRFIQRLGIKDISIGATETEMHGDWEAIHRNSSTPMAAVELLRKFHETPLLSRQSHDLLWRLMAESPIAADKMKGLLPKGTIVAHRSGWSGTTHEGITPASNDIGVIQLPNGRHFYLAVFVSESKEPEEVNKRVMAEIARSAWDYFSRSSALKGR